MGCKSSKSAEQKEFDRKVRILKDLKNEVGQYTTCDAFSIGRLASSCDDPNYFIDFDRWMGVLNTLRAISTKMSSHRKRHESHELTCSSRRLQVVAADDLYYEIRCAILTLEKYGHNVKVKGDWPRTFRVFFSKELPHGNTYVPPPDLVIYVQTPPQAGQYILSPYVPSQSASPGYPIQSQFAPGQMSVMAQQQYQNFPQVNPSSPISPATATLRPGHLEVAQISNSDLPSFPPRTSKSPHSPVGET